MSHKQLRILIAFPHALHRTGGMEKACISLANGMAERGHKVRISHVYGNLEPLFYPLHSDVERSSFMQSCRKNFSDPVIGRNLTLPDKIIRESLRIFNKRKASEWNEYCESRLLRDGIKREIAEFRPDVIVSFQLNMTYYLMKSGVDCPVITSFRFNTDHLMKKASKGDIEGLNWSSRIHVLVPSFSSIFFRFHIQSPAVCIPNAIPQYKHTADLKAERPVRRIINMARLNREQKRQHLLVEAFAKIAGDFPEWQVELWGDDAHYAGSYTEELRQFIREHHLEKRVLICGKTQDVESVYRRSDIFCLPSAFEGFSNALGEAMSAGLPAVGFSECPSLQEIIQNGKTGILAESGADSLADALKCLMTDQEKRVQMGKNAHEEMMKYAPEKIWSRWEQLLIEASCSKGNKVH